MIDYTPNPKTKLERKLDLLIEQKMKKRVTVGRIGMAVFSFVMFGMAVSLPIADILDTVHGYCQKTGDEEW